MRFNLSEDKSVERASVFRSSDLNDDLILNASFLDRCNLSGKRGHSWPDADLCGVNAPVQKIKNYFFTPRTASLAALATRNLIAFWSES